MHTAIPLLGLHFVGQRRDMILGQGQINKDKKTKRTRWLQCHLSLASWRMMEEEYYGCQENSLPQDNFETVGESVGHPCLLTLAMTDTPLRHLQGTEWPGRFHYKEIPGLYSTPGRSKGKNKSISGFSKKPLHKSVSTYIHITFSLMLITLIQAIAVQMGRGPGAFILPQSACQYTCGFKLATRPATALCTHPNLESITHPGTPEVLLVL